VLVHKRQISCGRHHLNSHFTSRSNRQQKQNLEKCYTPHNLETFLSQNPLRTGLHTNAL